ncbi:unnamed protein product, partial [Didymodactylos carnosus]
GSCSTAYFGSRGQCCAKYTSSPFCCAYDATCGTYGLCYTYKYSYRLTTWAYIGIVCGSLVFVAIIIAIIAVCKRQQNRSRLQQLPAYYVASPPPYPH